MSLPLLGTVARKSAKGKMAVADYKKYLAENVLNERRTVRPYLQCQHGIQRSKLTSRLLQVTYRSLSRALRVHCTLAKQ